MLFSALSRRVGALQISIIIIIIPNKQRQTSVLTDIYTLVNRDTRIETDILKVRELQPYRHRHKLIGWARRTDIDTLRDRQVHL